LQFLFVAFHKDVDDSGLPCEFLESFVPDLQPELGWEVWEDREGKKLRGRVLGSTSI
jgi:hypothetical protein